ncbi:MAG: Ig-like domain-containing protein, partial [Prosthecobacter sp.]|nr:Ig-like domain-containing protein [Prosthecobacter sp.]
MFRQHHPTTGVANWSFSAGGSNGVTAAISSGVAFVIQSGGSTSHLVCIDLTTKAERWRVTTGFGGTPAVAGSRVYAYDATGDVRAFDITTGALLQTYSTGLGFAAGMGSLDGNQPIITNDVMIGATTSTTVVVSLSTGVKLQTISAGGWLSLSNGYLMLAGQDGILRGYTLAGSDTAPVAQDVAVTCVEDQTVTLTLPGTDADGDALTAVVTTLPFKGTLYQTPDGVQIGEPISLLPAMVRNPERKLIYRPEADAFGTAYASFMFKVNDGKLNSAAVGATVNVSNVNDAPVATDDLAFLRAGAVLDGYWPTNNDVDVDGEALSIISFTTPANGVLTKNANGSLRYAPHADFTEGTDTFAYTAQDGVGLTASATVTVRVSASYGRAWTQFGNGPDHSGRYPALLGSQLWVQHWMYSYPATLNPVAVGGGRVYVTPTGTVANQTYVAALNQTTGGELWRAQMPATTRLNPPSYHSETVLTQRCNTSSDAQLWALNAADGSLRWQGAHGMQGGWYMSPAVSDLGVFINAAGFSSVRGVYGFNLLSGVQKFLSQQISTEYCTPAIHEGKVYSLLNGVFRNHHPDTGVVQWSADLTWVNSSEFRTICCEGGYAYLINSSTGGTDLICLDLQTQSVLWRIKGAYAGTPAVANGLVYACLGNVVRAHNTTTGRTVADYSSGSGDAFTFTGSPVISHDLLFAGTSSKTYIYNLATRALLQTLNFGSQVAIADDVLYLVCSDNTVRAYGRDVPGNLAPVAQNAQVGILEEAEAAITLEGTDGNGESLSFVVRTLPAKGTLYQTTDGFTKGQPITQVPAQVLHGGNSVVYQAPKDVFGTGVGSFTFTAHDQVSTSAAATVAIHVTNVNDAPTAVSDTVALRPGMPLFGLRPEANDWDIDGDAVTLFSFSQPASGRVEQAGDGSLTYLPNQGFVSGVDEFGYIIRDVHGMEANSTVRITVGASVGEDWPTFGAGPDHAGYQPLQLGSATLQQSWVKTLMTGPHQPAVAKGRVYIAGTGSVELAALNSATGTEDWRFSFPAGTGLNPPTWFNDSVYLQNSSIGSGKLYRLNSLTGTSVWTASYGAQNEKYMAPAVDAAGVYMNGGHFGGLYGVNHSGGQIFFNSSLPQFDGWTPTLHNGGLYSFVAGGFTNHHQTTGAALWSLNLTWNWSGYTMNRTVACADGWAYLVNQSMTAPAGSQELISIDLNGRIVAWKAQDKFTGTPAVAHQTVYVLTSNTPGSIKTYQATTGAPLAPYLLPGTETGLSVQPIVTVDSVIAASPTKTYIFDRVSRALRQTIPYGGNVCLAGRLLYIASSNGELRAFTTKPTNDAPMVLPVEVATAEDTPVDVDFHGLDLDGDPLRYIITSLPAVGTLQQIGDGTIAAGPITTVPTLVSSHAKVTYLPPADQNGTPLASFEYVASDNLLTSTVATATINV